VLAIARIWKSHRDGATAAPERPHETRRFRRQHDTGIGKSVAGAALLAASMPDIAPSA
jgi:hypothetical protein